MSIEHKIPLFYAVDDIYIPYIAVSIRSLIDNSSKENFYEIRILYTDVSIENQKKILEMATKNVSIEFVDLNESVKWVENKFQTRDYFSSATYYRLFIPNNYTDLDKAIYLDADTLILDDIAKLYNTNIGNNLLGAIPDQTISNWQEFRTYVELVVGLRNGLDYFNAGVLLMNLDELRKFKFQTKFIYLLDTIKFRVAQDQDYLNRICKGRVKLIDISWNTMSGVAKEFQAKKPKLIHFNLVAKPWHFEDVDFGDEFWEYAKKTVFYDYIQSVLKAYTDYQREEDRTSMMRLISLAEKENDCVGDDRNIEV